MQQMNTMADHSFIPGPETERQYRDALGTFGTGITVVTAMTDTGPVGITANSFTSVSLDPPLVLWSPGKQSRRYNAFIAAQEFAIHVLASNQSHLSRRFAQEKPDFNGLPVGFTRGGTPLLEGCLARFECTLYAVHDAGDHALVLGQVERVTSQSGAPLLFQQGRYGGFQAG